jgi:hypothetical protein
LLEFERSATFASGLSDRIEERRRIGMTISLLARRPDVLEDLAPDRAAPPPLGHRHSWEQAMSRGVLLRRSAGIAGAVLTSGAWLPALARAGGATTSAEPKPVPANPALGGFHVYLPGEGNEPSTIFDFNGFVGITEVGGTGTLTMADGSTQPAFFAVDNRFMKGEFVGADGRLHHGTFAFT